MKASKALMPAVYTSSHSANIATSAIGKPRCPNLSLTLTSILRLDYKTDSIIQNSLRHELREDVSLITVAHRLQTVMDMDKIVSCQNLVVFVLVY